jgi:hypothetical protein
MTNPTEPAGFPKYTLGGPLTVTAPSDSSFNVTVHVTMSENFPSAFEEPAYFHRPSSDPNIIIAPAERDFFLTIDPPSSLQLDASNREGDFTIQINKPFGFTASSRTYELDLSYQVFTYQGNTYGGYDTKLASTTLTILFDSGGGSGAPSIASSDKSETASLTLTEDASGNVTTAPVTGVIHFTDTDTTQRPTGSIKSQTVTFLPIAV